MAFLISGGPLSTHIHVHVPQRTVVLTKFTKGTQSICRIPMADVQGRAVLQNKFCSTMRGFISTIFYYIKT